MSPVVAFKQLKDALIRMTALDAQLSADDMDACGPFDEQVDRALEAFRHLAIEQDALAGIEEGLLRAYGAPD